MLDTAREEGPRIALSELNFGSYPTVARVRAESMRDSTADKDALERCRAQLGRSLNAEEADRTGLVTARPDELDWEDEVRIALEERRTLSPDALTGLEASLAVRSG